MTQIFVHGLTKTFGTITAVDNVSLTIHAGEFLTILGPSGSGKSTFLRLLAGLERADAGQIVIANTVVDDADHWISPQSRDIGMVFQNYALWPHMTVYAHIAFPMQMAGYPKKQIADRVEQLITLVELTGLEHKRPGTMSGGQQQRIALARALAGQPRILLMDECLSNLDTRLREKMGSELRQIQQHLGITSVYVTHDQHEALSLSDRIGVLHRGKLQQIGKPAQLYNQPCNALVASSLGTINLLTVANAQQIGCLLLQPVACDGQVTMGVRPEHIKLKPKNTSDCQSAKQDSAMNGIITQSVFMGNHARYRVDVGTYEFLVHAVYDQSVDSSTFTVGEPVCLVIAPQHWLVMESNPEHTI